jgi:hypothetical protein
MKNNDSHLLSLAASIAALFMLTGCGTTSTSKGASLGAVVGGLSGGTRGAATGALIGGGLGYLADRADDKAAARAQSDKEAAALRQAKITSNPQTAYRPDNINPLTGSTWRAISLVSDIDPPGTYSSVVVTFQTNSKVTTLAIPPEGDAAVFVETYRVVDDVLIISGKENGEAYVVNAKFSIENQQMIVVAPGLRVVLEEVDETV